MFSIKKDLIGRVESALPINYITVSIQKLFSLQFAAKEKLDRNEITIEMETKMTKETQIKKEKKVKKETKIKKETKNKKETKT